MTQPDGAASLAGEQILVVEDEAIVAMLLENILEDIGCTPVGPALTLEQAHTLSAAEGRLDAAILDVNLRGERVYPVAEVLRGRGMSSSLPPATAKGAWTAHGAAVQLSRSPIRSTTSSAR